MTDTPPIKPASTVVLLRDSDNGPQTLMLRRNKALIFAGGAWVFPGGSLDPEDIEAGSGDIERAARIAAAREAQEEAGLDPAPEDMILLSHWTTPVGEPRRFSTWIFAAPLHGEQEVVIDGGEIHDSQWMDVSDAVDAHERGELNMLPPTYITLRTLAPYDTVTAMVDGERDRPVPEVFPVFSQDGDNIIVMFRGDAGYEAGDGGAPGARHRAILEGHTWRYQHEDVDTEYPNLIPQNAG
ncbi:MAG: NUDIX domain-containing protein [Halioglobus sp.]|nr:NUDIX domain-containing protein [Halioglobus sp.]